MVKAFEAAQRKSSSSTAGKRSLSSPVRLGGRANAAMRKKSRFGKPSAKTSTESSRVTDGRERNDRNWDQARGKRTFLTSIKLGYGPKFLFLTIPEASDLEVGDLVGFGISHPCTTFDKWRTLLVVDDDFEVKALVHTFF